MTQERMEALAKKCARLTENLPYKVNRLGEVLVTQMETANKESGQMSYKAMETYGRINGVLDALSILGIPHEIHWQGERDKYISIDIAGKPFYVNNTEEEPNGTE